MSVIEFEFCLWIEGRFAMCRHISADNFVITAYDQTDMFPITLMVTAFAPAIIITVKEPVRNKPTGLLRKTGGSFFNIVIDGHAFVRTMLTDWFILGL